MRRSFGHLRSPPSCSPLAEWSLRGLCPLGGRVSRSLPLTPRTLRLLSTAPAAPSCPRGGGNAGDEGAREQVSMFYDGKCPLCAYEVSHYQRLDKDKKNIRFLDINDDGVKDVLAEKGLTFDDAMARMHVETKDGRMVEGVESFVQVWQELPYWRHLVPLARVPGVTWVLHQAYTAFARNRLWLTGRDEQEKKD